MARIKFVLNERRLAYEGALRLLIKQKEEAESINETRVNPKRKRQASAALSDELPPDRVVRDDALEAKAYAGEHKKSRAKSSGVEEAVQRKEDSKGEGAKVDVKTTAAARFAAASLFAPTPKDS
jgi:hypothetical protein